MMKKKERKKPLLNMLTTFVMLNLSCVSPLLAQGDSIVFFNGNYMTGTVESMNKGVFVFSTDYSDDDFTIEWEKIMELYTTTIFVVTLSDGTELVASLRTLTPGRLQITVEGAENRVVGVDEVVELNPLGDKFMDRVTASWDLGYTYTKSSDNTQFNARTFLGYEAKLWNTDISFSSIYSAQEDVDATRVLNGTWNFRFNLPAKLFLIATVNLLSDSEQQLNLRSNSQGGAGAYIVRSNAAYLSSKLGLNRNYERYTDSSNDRNSWEGFMGAELNIYDLGDLDFLTAVVFYPGITEKGRWRSDMSFDVKYEFPMDFYIKGGFTLNWDNQPVEGAESTNLILLAGFGWEW